MTCNLYIIFGIYIVFAQWAITWIKIDLEDGTKREVLFWLFVPVYPFIHSAIKKFRRLE